MTTVLIVLVLLALVGVVVFFATRKKTGGADPAALPRETDTGWSDPVTPGQPSRTDLHNDSPRDEPRV